jgi:hypothetical protein
MYIFVFVNQQSLIIKSLVMKNLIVTLSFALAAGLTPVLATPVTSTPIMEEVFAQKFAGAENVKWTKLDEDYQKVSFTLGGTRAEAYFGTNGELLGTVRNLFFSQLPLVVMQAVGNRFDNAAIIEVKEITNNDGTSYRVVLEHKEKKYNIKLNSAGDITEQQKEKLKK